jgi:hypothetical protein
MVCNETYERKIMHESLNIGARKILSVLNTRTGFLGLGPTYGEIAIAALLGHLMEKHNERSVVRGAEKMLAEIDERNKTL